MSRRSGLLLATLLAARLALGPAAVPADETDGPAGDPFDDPFGIAADGEIDGLFDDPFGEDLFDEFDALFSDPDMIDVADEAAMADRPQDDLLRSERVEWGGRFRGSLSADWSWDTVWTPEFRPADPTGDSLSPRLGADLFFTARPSAVYRVSGRFRIDTTTAGGFALTGLAFGLPGLTAGLPPGWTAEETADGRTEIRDADGVLIATIGAGDQEEAEEDRGALGSAPGLSLSVYELFSDFVYDERLFFRFGKHTIKWGTGYFFSPADVLNLSAVDPEDPTADRQGPLSLRVIRPFGITDAAYLYLIANTGAGILDVALAPRVEFGVGNGELALGAYHQRTLAPRLVALFSGTVRQTDVFGEAAVLRGSDRVFVRPSRDQSAAAADPDDGPELVLETFRVETGLFLQATAGARYIKQWDDGRSLVMIGQYFFNGSGYDSSVPGLLPAAVRLLFNPAENGLALPASEQGADYEAPPNLRFSDLASWGRHYVGGTVSVSSFLLDDLSMSLFGLVNLNDLSGIVTPSVSYRFLDRFSLSLSSRFTFGPAHGEYTNPAALFARSDVKPTFGVTLSLSMPGGAF